MSESDNGAVQEKRTDDSERPPESAPTQSPTASGRQRTDADSEDGSLPLDQVFEILKNSRRRETLHYLDENDGRVDLSGLAEHIAALENETTVQQITSSQRKRVYVGLYQCHLPKMDDMSVVDFDKNRGTIEVGRNADQVRSYLGDEDGREWYKLYLTLAAVGTVLFLASVAGAAEYGLEPAVVLVLLLGSILLGAIAHASEYTSIRE